MNHFLKTVSMLLPAACLVLGACSFHGTETAGSTAESSGLQILTIGTADSGGTMYPVGKAIADTISGTDSHIKINISASHGSADNVRALESGTIDLGMVSGDVAFSAVTGSGEFSEKPAEDLRAIAALYPSLSNWMTSSSSGLTWVHQLKGKRIGIGPQDSTTEISAQIVLRTLNITEKNSTLENCGIGSGADSVLAGSLDAVHGFAGIPVSGLSQMAETVPCTLLKYTDRELEQILDENSFYYKDVIPAGTYAGQEEDVPTFGIKCLLCVRADMDEDLVYELTSILYENVEQLKEAHGAFSSLDRNGFMYSALPIRLHPGAERFYLENNLIWDGNADDVP